MHTSSDSLPRAVLWDMDGTLLDSAEYHWLSWREALAAEGYALTREQFARTFGQRNDTILRTLFGPELSDAAIQRIGDAKEQRYRELIRERGIDLLPGARDWLARLHAAGWRQAIASSAPRLNIEAILDVLAIRPFFDALVSAEDVQRGKPDPQVFLVAAARLDVPPERCVVVEDAAAGVEAARRAGMRVIAVGTAHPPHSADLVTPSLDRLPEDAFERLIPAAARQTDRSYR
ncbi:HAD family hydrolase [Kallotenue papyrolyticum]|uniref:HAD family hydrolase n=1 Tax=Kallotenue papyrolyticum TaxID=1325125 RepID=UPI0004B1BE47|nr:HAD family phosphatase [Kallotenue papyrolyticum]